MSPKPRKRAYPNLATWREANRINQREAADVLGFSQSKYGRLERGVLTVVGEEAIDIMDKTGVPLEVLVGVSR